MNNNQPDRVLAFDSLFTTNHIQMLKLLIGYLAPSVQGKMAVYIKFMEFGHTLKMVANHPTISVTPCCSPADPSGISLLLDEMLPFCRPEEQEQLQGMKNMFQTFENIQGVMEMIDMMKEIAPEMFDTAAPGGINFSDTTNTPQGTDMSQMMELVNMMQSMFTTPNEEK